MTLRTMSSREILARAVGKEQEACLFYKLYAGQVEDYGSKVLLEELAEEELRHKETLENFDEKKVEGSRSEKIEDVRISDFLTGGLINREAKIRDVLIYAIKEEEAAHRFYSSWIGYLEDETISGILERLAREELKHKVKLERIYEELFLPED